VFVFAAPTASRSEQDPSLATVSPVVVTGIVAAAALAAAVASKATTTSAAHQLNSPHNLKPAPWSPYHRLDEAVAQDYADPARAWPRRLIGS
jgi:hypothetical protein